MIPRCFTEFNHEATHNDGGHRQNRNTSEFSSEFKAFSKIESSIKNEITAKKVEHIKRDIHCNEEIFNLQTQ